MSPYEAFCVASEFGTSKDLEEIISTSGLNSFMYAKHVLNGPFSAGEAQIADSNYALDYACNILKSRFELGEKRISEDGIQSYKYAISILKGPFEAGESAISELSRHYHVGMCGKHYNTCSMDYQFRFNRNICSSEKLSEYPAYALAHAIMIGGRFPEGEPAMKSSPRIWKRYQEFIDESQEG